jgi:C-terminal processing protease CtpA/Prc
MEMNLQLGIVIDGTRIDSVLPGTPAHESKELFRGDEIVAVNGIIASEENIQKLLCTKDFLGNPVMITVANQVCHHVRFE